LPNALDQRSQLGVINASLIDPPHQIMPAHQAVVIMGQPPVV
jgi:hypothetical protein